MSNNSNYKSKIQFKQKICNKPHIYKITNQIDGKYYYGVHNGSDTENYEGSGKLLHRAYEKHGKENFKKEILMWFDTMEEAFEYEAVVVNEKMINKNNSMCYNISIGGKGGDIWSCQTPERQEEIIQKCSEASIKMWEDMCPEKREEISQQRRGENNPMFGKNSYDGKSEEEKVEINQKKSDSRKKLFENMTPEELTDYGKKFSGENNGMFGQGHKVSGEKNGMFGRTGEKNGQYTKYRHPYNPNITGNCHKIRFDIRNNWPDKPQWHQISWKQKELLKIKEEQNEK